MDFGTGAGFTAARILRGNGASGYEGNGLNVDTYTGFRINLNALGGSGGSFTVSGGNITTTGTINTVSIPNDLFAFQFLLMGS